MRWAALGVDFEMFGKDHQTNAPIYDRICEILGGQRARALCLRAVPRRDRPEDFEVQGQWPDHRRMADLCLAREPRALHVPEAARRQAALFRRHPARRRRVLPVRRGLPAARTPRRARREPGLPHPCRQAAGSTCRRSRFALLLNLVSASNAHDTVGAVGLHLALRAGRDGRDQSRARPARGLCGALFQRRGEADEDLPRADRQGTRGAAGSRRPARRQGGLDRRRGAAEPRLRGRQDASASSRCATGSRRSTRCCSAPTRARASAPSSRCSASPKRGS